MQCKWIRDFAFIGFKITGESENAGSFSKGQVVHFHVWLGTKPAFGLLEMARSHFLNYITS